MIHYYDTINYLNNTEIFVFVVETQFANDRIVFFFFFFMFSADSTDTSTSICIYMHVYIYI